MEIHIPSSFVEVDSHQFWKLLDQIDYRREAYCDGEYYEARGWEKQYQQKYLPNSVRTIWISHHVAIHTKDDRWYIDPEFFKLVIG